MNQANHNNSANDSNVEPSDHDNDPLERYSRQVLFPPIGVQGQQRLSRAHVTLIGCGALGSAIAEMIVRAGIGHLLLIDRDFVELSNLQRQMLFDERDVAENLPKAQAAARRLRQINSSVEITPIVADVNHENIQQFVEQSTLILDGTDNLQTRYLINDVAIKLSIPWVYGACIAARGMVMAIQPGGRPCLRCLFDEPPEPGQMETCDTAGIIGPIVNIIAGLQVTEALKLLAADTEATNPSLINIELWQNQLRQTPLDNLTDGCACCRDRNFEFLGGRGSLSTISLCGSNAVQIRPRRQHPKLDLAELAGRLAESGPVTRNEFLLKLTLPDREMTVFPDGRAIVKGTNSIDEARSLYARYVGH